MMTYYRLPSIVNGLKRLWHWWADPTDHHTVIGRCVCSVCTTHLWKDHYR